MSLCVLTIAGNLGGDPEIRDVSDTTVCSFSVAVNRRVKGEDFTDWYRVSVWGKQGENCHKYLSKGSGVAVSGDVAQRDYTDKNGNARVSMDVRANTVHFLGKKDDNDGGDGGSHAGQSGAPAASASGDDDIPF